MQKSKCRLTHGKPQLHGYSGLNAPARVLNPQHRWMFLVCRLHFIPTSLLQHLRQSLIYTAICSSLNGTSCLCVCCHCSITGMLALLAMLARHYIKTKVKFHCSNLAKQTKHMQIRIFEQLISKAFTPDFV